VIHSGDYIRTFPFFYDFYSDRPTDSTILHSISLPSFCFYSDYHSPILLFYRITFYFWLIPLIHLAELHLRWKVIPFVVPSHHVPTCSLFDDHLHLQFHNSVHSFGDVLRCCSSTLLPSDLWNTIGRTFSDRWRVPFTFCIYILPLSLTVMGVCYHLFCSAVRWLFTLPFIPVTTVSYRTLFHFCSFPPFVCSTTCLFCSTTLFYSAFPLQTRLFDFLRCLPFPRFGVLRLGTLFYWAVRPHLVCVLLRFSVGCPFSFYLFWTDTRTSRSFCTARWILRYHVTTHMPHHVTVSAILPLYHYRFRSYSVTILPLFYRVTFRFVPPYQRWVVCTYLLRLPTDRLKIFVVVFRYRLLTAILRFLPLPF